MHEPPRHGPLIMTRKGPPAHRALRLAIAVCSAGAGFCLVLAMVTLVVALNGTPERAVTARRSSPPPASATPGNAPATPRTVGSGGQVHGLPEHRASGRPARARYEAAPRTRYNRYGTSASHVPAPAKPTPNPRRASRARRMAKRTSRTQRTFDNHHIWGSQSTRAAAPEAKLLSRFALAATTALYRGTGPGTLRSFRVGAPGEWGMSWYFRCGSGRPSSFAVRESSRVSPKDLALSVFGPSGRGLSWNTLDPGTHKLAVETACSWVIKIVAP